MQDILTWVYMLGRSNENGLDTSPCDGDLCFSWQHTFEIFLVVLVFKLLLEKLFW